MEESRNRSRIVSFSVATSILSIGSLIFAYIGLNSLTQTSWVVLAVAIVLVIITLGLGTFQVFDKARELKTKGVREQTRPLKITLEIDGEPITIEASDTKRVEEILKLVQGLHTRPSSSINDTSETE